MRIRQRITIFAITLSALSLWSDVLAGQLTPPWPPLPPPPPLDTTHRPITVIAEPRAAVGRPFYLQWRGQNGGGDLSRQVAMSDESWSRMWSMVGQRPPRALDSTREMAVLIAIGERPTGGYRVDVVRTTNEGGVLVVEYVQRAPSPDQVVTQAFTNPWVIAVIPRSSLPVRFRVVS